MRYTYGAASERLSNLTVTVLPDDEPSLLAEWKDYERRNRRANTRYEKDTRSIDNRYDRTNRGQYTDT